MLTQAFVGDWWDCSKVDQVWPWCGCVRLLYFNVGKNVFPGDASGRGSPGRYALELTLDGVFLGKEVVLSTTSETLRLLVYFKCQVIRDRYQV